MLASRMWLVGPRHIYNGKSIHYTRKKLLKCFLKRLLLSDKPDIVIATPSRALALLQSKAISLSSLESLVIDEADLILSYGHDEDVRQIFNGAYLPKVYQSFLMSATMTEDVEMLKGLALRNPVRLLFLILFITYSY